MSMKKSTDTIGNRTRDLPVCSAVPEPLRHRVPRSYYVDYTTLPPISVHNSRNIQVHTTIILGTYNHTRLNLAHNNHVGSCKQVELSNMRLWSTAVCFKSLFLKVHSFRQGHIPADFTRSTMRPPDPHALTVTLNFTWINKNSPHKGNRSVPNSLFSSLVYLTSLPATHTIQRGAKITSQ
jgi:hypothetical protein